MEKNDVFTTTDLSPTGGLSDFNPDDELAQIKAENDVAEDQFSPVAGIDDVFEHEVHLRVQKRTARKAFTMIEGLTPPKGKEHKDVIKFLKKTLSCSVCVKQDKEDKDYYQLAGDHRDELIQILVNKYQVKREKIIVHGF